MKVRDLLTDESKWTQGCFAKDGTGAPIEHDAAAAECWCVAGALRRCYPNTHERDDAYNRLYKIIDRSIAAWNDEPQRTFADIRRVIEQADI